MVAFERTPSFSWSNNNPLCGWTTFCYPFVYRCVLGCFYLFGCCELCCYEHSCTSIYSNPVLSSLGYVPTSGRGRVLTPGLTFEEPPNCFPGLSTLPALAQHLPAPEADPAALLFPRAHPPWGGADAAGALPWERTGLWPPSALPVAGKGGSPGAAPFGWSGPAQPPPAGR